MTVAEVITKLEEIDELISRTDARRLDEDYYDAITEYLDEYRELLRNMKVVNK